MKRWLLVADIYLAHMLVLGANGPIGRYFWCFDAFYLGGYVWSGCYTAYACRMVLRAHGDHGVGARNRRQDLILGGGLPGNDIGRCLWEGFTQIHGFNPCRYPPDSPALQIFVQGPLKQVWMEVPHKPLSAIYPPQTLLFRFLSFISPSIWLFKPAMLLFDLLLVGGIVALLGCLRLPAVRFGSAGGRHRG